MDPQLAMGQFVTLTGGAALITAIVEVVKRTFAWTDAATQRFAPITSIAVGVVLFVLVTAATAAAMTGAIFAGAALGGIVAGMYACGIYNLGGKTVIEAVAGEHGAG